MAELRARFAWWDPDSRAFCEQWDEAEAEGSDGGGAASDIAIGRIDAADTVGKETHALTSAWSVGSAPSSNVVDFLLHGSLLPLIMSRSPVHHRVVLSVVQAALWLRYDRCATGHWSWTSRSFAFVAKYLASAPPAFTSAWLIARTHASCATRTFLLRNVAYPRRRRRRLGLQRRTARSRLCKPIYSTVPA